MMTFAQYCRIETAAGGALCSNRDFIRAARGLLHDEAMHHDWRARRHAWLRAGLAMLQNSRAQALSMGAASWKN
jgi:hypothetical protein